MVDEWIKLKIEEFQQRFEEVKDDAEDFDDELVKVYRMEPAEYFDLIGKRSATDYGKLFFKDFHDFVVTVLIPYYLKSTEEVREALLILLDKNFRVQLETWSLMKEYRWKLQHTVQEERAEVLRRLLLFAVLQEEHLDAFETANLLRGARNEARYQGMDPVPFFKQAAAVAGRRKIIFGRSAQEVLEEYCTPDLSGSKD